MTAVEILIAADALLSDEMKWTRCAFARGWGGQVVEVSPKAACFCSMGAMLVFRTDDSDSDDAYSAALALLKLAAWPARGIADWNDAPARTFAEVKAAFARAIELARNA